jgi:hypothetical protein
MQEALHSRIDNEYCGNQDQCALDAAGKIFSFIMAIRMRLVRRGSATVNAVKATKAAARFTTDSIASDRRLTESVQT